MAPWLELAAAAYRRRRALARQRSAVRRAVHAVHPLFAVSSFPPLPGVNLAGYLRAELGVGEAARRLVAGLEAGHILQSTITHAAERRASGRSVCGDAKVAYYERTSSALTRTSFRASVRRPARLLPRRYTIGSGSGRSSRFPRAARRRSNYVDEIWVASEFVADAICARESKPVRVVPLPVEPPRANHSDARRRRSSRRLRVPL